MLILALRSSRRRLNLSFLGAVLFSLFLPTAAPAESHARIVRLSYLDGNVELDRGDGRGFSTASLNMPVTHLSKLWARDGQAEVEFEDGNTIRLTPDTIVAFNDLSLDSDGRRNTAVQLQQGTAYFDIPHHDSENFTVQLGRGQVRATKAARFRIDEAKRQFEVAVLNGEIQVANATGSEVAVKKDETIRLDPDDSDRYYLTKGVAVENYDSWETDRIKARQLAESAAILSGHRSLNYGLSDLSAYGSYFYLSGYGQLWQPWGMSPGWDPFANGYWVSYPGYGYLFVSSYPWGWAPYRYGSWQFVEGRGWCWSASSNWNSWNAVPPARNLPPHFRPPQMPRHGPPVITVNNGAPAPVVNTPVVIDNDMPERRRPHSAKVISDAGIVLRQGQATSPAPTPMPVPSTMPVPRTRALGEEIDSGESRQIAPPGSFRRMEGTGPEIGRIELNQPPQAPTSSGAGQRTIAPVAAAPAPSPSFSRPETRWITPTPSPRMESHPSPPPAMHNEGRSMGAVPHTNSSPGVSAGGGRGDGSGSAGRSSSGPAGGRAR